MVLSGLIAVLLVQLPPAAGPDVPVGRCDTTEHVVLVSIDGFRPDFYLKPEWPAPTLQRMAAEGAWSEGSQTIFPSITYPSHTTLVTGFPSAEHGVFYNRPESLGGGAEQQYFWADSIRVPALWDRVRADGRVAAGFWWPAAIGADMDVNVPVPPHPGAGETRLDLLRGVVQPAGFMERMEREVTGPLTDAAFRNGTLSKERHLAAMARHVILESRPDLLLYHFLATDAFQHEHGPDHPAVREAVALADSVLGVLVRTYEEAGMLDRTKFVITGDHGFAEYTHGIAPNLWLAGAGLLEADGSGLPRARFVTGGGYAMLFMRDDNDSEVLSAVRAAIDRLPAAERARFDLLEPRQLSDWGVDPRVRLALSARPGTRFEGRSTGAFVAPTAAPGGAHGHRPDLPELRTGFLVWGTGTRHQQLDGVHALHTTPLIARLLGLPADERWTHAPWIDQVVCGR